MRIERILLKNFSSHKNTKHRLPGKVNIIVGQMNAGKSSIAQAIEVAMTGQCQFYRKKNSPTDELAFDGKRKGTDTQLYGIELEISSLPGGGSGNLSRGKSAVASGEFMSWGSEAESVAKTEATLMRDIGVTKLVLSTLLNTTEFFSLEPKDQRQFVLNMIGAEVTMDQVRDAFDGDEEALDMLPVQPSSLADLERIHKWAYNERTGVDRTLRELKPMDPKEGTPPNLDNIRSKLGALEAEEKKLIANLATAKSGQVGNRPLIDSLTLQKKQLDEWILSNPPPSRGDIEKLIERMKNVENEASNALGQKNLATKKLNDARVELGIAQKNVELLNNFKGVCVAGPHECPVPPDHMEIAKNGQEVRVNSATEKITRFEKEVDEWAQKSDASKVMVTIEREKTELEHRVETSREKSTELGRIEKQLRDLGDPEEDPDARARVDELSSELEAIQQRIAVGRDKFEAAMEWENYNKQVAAVSEKRRSLEVQSRRIHSLVDFFGPKGIRAQLVDQKIEGFEKAINKSLKRFGFEMKFQSEPWSVVARGRTGTRLSRSERFRLGVALQIAMAEFTGVRFVLIDNAELLTPGARNAMIKMLLESDLDQAIVIITLMVPNKNFTPPETEGASFHLVTNTDGISSITQL